MLRAFPDQSWPVGLKQVQEEDRCLHAHLLCGQGCFWSKRGGFWHVLPFSHVEILRFRSRNQLRGAHEGWRDSQEAESPFPTVRQSWGSFRRAFVQMLGSIVGEAGLEMQFLSA